MAIMGLQWGLNGVSNGGLQWVSTNCLRCSLPSPLLSLQPSFPHPSLLLLSSFLSFPFHSPFRSVPFLPLLPLLAVFRLRLSPSATVAVLRGDSSVGGTVTFEQASESSPTTIHYNIKGNDPSAKRGMHVHQFGDNTNGCTSAGPHCTFP